ncbi:MAG TPA: MFS transporter, partial [Nitrospiria bacterium]|nr:MFS transporter [Nitrospiria bacterium]
MKQRFLLRPGDLNAFFGLMLDNVTQLVILGGILIGVFGFPQDLVLYRIIPGCVVGVLIGDLVFTWMALNLARRTGRSDVCAMPLGIDTVSLFAFSFGIIGPAYAVTGDAEAAWKVAMASIVTAGAVKTALAFPAPVLQRIVPRAGLLGPIAAVAILLIGFFPSLKIFHHPVVGFISMVIIFSGFIGKVRMPAGIPAALAGVVVGTLLYYIFAALGWLTPVSHGVDGSEWVIAFPWPTLGFMEGLSGMVPYLPLILPFALTIVIGGVDVTESAAAGGDSYNARSIVFADGLSTLAGGLCGGVVQTTPYIGQPAYKDMGAGAGYTLGTALFVGLGGVLGYLAFFVDLIPEAAVAPILVFIGIEIMSQAFSATPQGHHKAVALSFLPSVAYLVMIQVNSALAGAGVSAADLTGEAAVTMQAVTLMANGFIISSLIWAAALSRIIDQRFGSAALFFAAGGLACLFGIIHSPFPDGRLFFPWSADSTVPFSLFGAYILSAGVLFLLGRQKTD